MGDSATGEPATSTSADSDKHAPTDAHRARGVRSSLLKTPTIAGSAVALAFWWVSLEPSLLPRSWAAQAVISAICLTVGYALGTLIAFAVTRATRQFGPVRRVLDQPDEAPPPKPNARYRLTKWGQTMWVLWVLGTFLGLEVWVQTQNEQRVLVELDPIPTVAAVPLALATFVLAVLLGLLGRLVAHGVGAIKARVTRRVPAVWANLVTAVIVVALVGVLSQEVVARGLVRWADDRFGALDRTDPPGGTQPTSELISGGPGSLVSWDSLGLQGRAFTGEPVTAAQIEAFDDRRAVSQPIRVYAGLLSAESDADRAALVVDELERTGAFERSVLVVATSTGTGWVDPDTAAAIEYLWAGDTAIASMQYSFLPSWISFLVDRDSAGAAGIALYEAVHSRWSQLDEQERPLLLVFGLSLGSLGAEAAFAEPGADASADAVINGADGMLFTGPTATNPVWRQLTAARDSGSPPWQPVFDGGEHLRFAIDADSIDAHDEQWQSPRTLWVHHPNDPVGAWQWRDLWSQPDWTRDPVGPGLPKGVRWTPFITWVQSVADLAAGFSTAPGNGHNYADVPVEAWAAVATPPDWTEQDTVSLSQHLAATIPDS